MKNPVAETGEVCLCMVLCGIGVGTKMKFVNSSGTAAEQRGEKNCAASHEGFGARPRPTTCPLSATYSSAAANSCSVAEPWAASTRTPLPGRDKADCPATNRAGQPMPDIQFHSFFSSSFALPRRNSVTFQLAFG